MQKIDLRKDAATFRSELQSTVEALSKSLTKQKPISALEFGYDCDQGGWIFIHADFRPIHQRDGEWTLAIEESNIIEMDHWTDALNARFEGEDLEVTDFKGNQFVIPAYQEDEHEEDDEDEPDQLTVAIGEMLLAVVTDEKSKGLFSKLKQGGELQLDFEDFNGEWGWPEFDELGKTNLA